MKKIFVFSFFSVIISFFVLYYVNFVLLNDSSITNNANLNQHTVSNIAFIPKGYSKSSYNESHNKIVLLNNNIVYLVDLEKKESKLLRNLSFVFDVSFIDNNNILFVTKNNNGIVINKYSIEDEIIEKLGELSFKYFTDISNVYVENESIYFTVNYSKNNSKGSKSYVFKNNRISSVNTSSSVPNKLTVYDTTIYTNNKDNTYINNALFTYKDNSNLVLLGKDSKNIVYLLDKTNEYTIVSLDVSDSINILDEYNLDDISYKYITITDSIYIVSDTFVYDLNNNVVLPVENRNILLIANGCIYYEDEGEILSQSILGGK